MPGATVVIGGTMKGAYADENGTFILSNLNEGKYDLVVEYLGYGKDTIRGVIVNDAAATKITVGLPAGKCYEKVDSKACPMVGKSKNVIPIIYSLPDKTQKKIRERQDKIGRL